MAEIVEAILTAILQWRVAWLDEQKSQQQPPPICRQEPRKLKITYDNYKDYESTFVPLLMHEIWAQIYEEWTKIENEINGVPMDVDDAIVIPQQQTRFDRNNKKSQLPHACPRQFHIGIIDYRTEGQVQCVLRCQALIDFNQLQTHMKLIGEGDLVRLDLVVDKSDINGFQQQQPQVFPTVSSSSDPRLINNSNLSLFGYVMDVSAERVAQYTTVAECFSSRPSSRNFYVVNYQIVIAKRPLRLQLRETMKISCLYYLKPMIRQIEAVTTLINSPLSSDILSPKHVTCQLSIPTIALLKSTLYNDMQYKAIFGANEALCRSIPKIQLIQGPPGTGKTHTLVGLIKHFYSKWRDTTKMPKILICAPSNGAVDEIVKRLFKERDFLKKFPPQRSLRLVRIGHPDQISEAAKACSLEDLVETNANQSINSIKRKHEQKIKELEEELSKCDTEITNLRYTNREKEVPSVEAKIVRLLKELELVKSNEDVKAKREVSEASKKNMRYAIIRNADVILATLNSCQRHPLDALFKGDRAELSFHCVIVDEASQCCEPELLMPLCYNITKMILIGDPMQLPATVISRFAQEFNFGRSLFERFFIHFGEYNSSSPIAMLTEQYRMHPEICRFPSEQFYDGRLISAKKVVTRHPLRPYIMFDLRHSTESKNSGTSLENHAEADLVKNLLVAVLTKAPERSQVGVITPYKGQKRLITNKISHLQAERHITIDVNTCDGFQGQERDIIILSCVRAFESNSNSIGFLKSVQRLNVALTRAKHCLIVCISAKSLSKNKTWEALINDALERKVMQSLTTTPSSLALINMITSNENEAEQQSTTTNSFTSRLINQSSQVPSTLESFDKFVPMPMDID